MRILKKAAVSMTAVGLIAAGALAGSGGSAFAVAPQSMITGCSAVAGTGTDSGFQPNCTAASGTIDTPTAITVGLNTTQLGALITAQFGQGLDAQWTLNCVVNGRTVTVPGSYDITSVQQSATTTIDLQTAVGSPAPNSCTVEQLLAQTALPFTHRAALAVKPFTVAAAAEANTAVAGAIYQAEGLEMLCADDTANGNAGSKIQGFQCLSDLADSFVRTASGQLVHNGDCVGLSGSNVVLAACTANNTGQEWSQTTVGGTVKNVLSGTCLTASSVRNGTQLTVAACGSGADQKWHLPAAAA